MIRIVACMLAFSAFAFASPSLAQTVPSHGPQIGTLVITGGGTIADGNARFLAAAGGAAAKIVVIPTASVTEPQTAEQLQKYCSIAACTVLHTTDRAIADSEAFVKPLREATGVMLIGGRQWRLADAYNGTRTLTEIRRLLDRGGVVYGGSAGATIQGSYLVRGSSTPDDNTIVMAPGHEIGFGLLTNVAIDQHVDARGRANDLAVVLRAHPELLGLGLDQGTTIVVHGDELTAIGPGRVAVWDGREHDGKGYYYLLAGDRLNTATRTATFAAHEQKSR